MTTFFIQAFIYLCAAVVVVPVARKLGLGSVLGYLTAGVFIGPVLGLVGAETVTIQHYAEFGVVMMLFLVGLELEPKVLWSMRNRLLGLGGLQVVVTTLAIMAIAMAFSLQWNIALTIGMIFSMSSTAIVLQTFDEKGLSKSFGAKNAFSVLLFQDLAVLPMLAVIPLMALGDGLGANEVAQGHEANLLTGMPVWVQGPVVVAIIVAVVFAMHFLTRPVFNYVAKSGLREIFTTTALLLVVGTATLMSLLGLSPALGAFMAGVVLAGSEFRHELKSNIEPFKGLLMGLFFITVGAGINFAIIGENAAQLIMLVIAVMAVKAIVLYLAARLFRLTHSDRWLFTLSLAQAGEFGFVLINYSMHNHVLPVELSQTLSLVVALSMFLTPGLFIVFDKLVLPAYTKSREKPAADVIDEQGPVIIAGIGRFGQLVNRLLTANGVKTVVLDHDANQVELMRRINIKSFYGDATHPELLHTAGIEHARLLVVAIDDQQSSVQLVQYMKRHYPNVTILARAFDRRHLYRLKSVAADIIVPEVYFSALEAGKAALMQVGFHPFHAEQLRATFVETELAHKQQLFEAWEKGQKNDQFNHYRDLFMKLETVLTEQMKQDRHDTHSRCERGWSPPPRDYADELAGQEES